MQNPVNSAKEYTIKHRIQMHTVCEKLGRKNFPSRQVMRRVALMMLKDARRDMSRTTRSITKRVENNHALIDSIKYPPLVTASTVEEARHIVTPVGRIEGDREAARAIIADIVGERAADQMLSTPLTGNELKPNLESLSVAALLALGRDMKLKVTTKMTKAKLIEVISAG